MDLEDLEDKSDDGDVLNIDIEDDLIESWRMVQGDPLEPYEASRLAMEASAALFQPTSSQETRGRECFQPDQASAVGPKASAAPLEHMAARQQKGRVNIKRKRNWQPDRRTWDRGGARPEGPPRQRLDQATYFPGRGRNIGQPAMGGAYPNWPGQGFQGTGRGQMWQQQRPSGVMMNPNATFISPWIAGCDPTDRGLLGPAPVSTPNMNLNILNISPRLADPLLPDVNRLDVPTRRYLLNGMVGCLQQNRDEADSMVLGAAPPQAPTPAAMPEVNLSIWERLGQPATLRPLDSPLREGSNKKQQVGPGPNPMALRATNPSLIMGGQKNEPLFQVPAGPYSRGFANSMPLGYPMKDAPRKLPNEGQRQLVSMSMVPALKGAVHRQITTSEDSARSAARLMRPMVNTPRFPSSTLRRGVYAPGFVRPSATLRPTAGAPVSCDFRAQRPAIQRSTRPKKHRVMLNVKRKIHLEPKDSTVKVELNPVNSEIPKTSAAAELSPVTLSSSQHFGEESTGQAVCAVMEPVCAKPTTDPESVAHSKPATEAMPEAKIQHAADVPSTMPALNATDTRGQEEPEAVQTALSLQGESQLSVSAEPEESNHNVSIPAVGPAQHEPTTATPAVDATNTRRKEDPEAVQTVLPPQGELQLSVSSAPEETNHNVSIPAVGPAHEPTTATPSVDATVTRRKEEPEAVQTALSQQGELQLSVLSAPLVPQPHKCVSLLPDAVHPAMERTTCDARPPDCVCSAPDRSVNRAMFGPPSPRANRRHSSSRDSASPSELCGHECRCLRCREIELDRIERERRWEAKHIQTLRWEQRMSERYGGRSRSPEPRGSRRYSPDYCSDRRYRRNEGHRHRSERHMHEYHDRWDYHSHSDSRDQRYRDHWRSSTARESSCLRPARLDQGRVVSVGDGHPSASTSRQVDSQSQPVTTSRQQESSAAKPVEEDDFAALLIKQRLLEEEMLRVKLILEKKLDAQNPPRP